jgi:Ca2+-binding RTX toxin-like protein
MANITGTSKNDTLTGGDFNDVIKGLAGADQMSGGFGNDTYYRDNAGDVIIEDAAAGTDTIISTIAFNTAVAHVENYDFGALAGGVDFTGNDLDNAIKGGKGIDTLAGGGGQDFYYLSSAKDIIIEAADKGFDTAVAGFSLDLNNYANVEHARLTGSAALNAFGTSAQNQLIGNAGKNVLDGRGGADILQGEKGNDTYHVDNKSDLVIEEIGGGLDTVISTDDYDLHANVEIGILAEEAGNSKMNGNKLNNTLIGNTWTNILDGGIGADVMKGGIGNDVYYVDNIGDKVIENAFEGNADAVTSQIDFSLAALKNVESLLLFGNAIKATGNAAGNQIVGNDRDNVINGAAGADTMQGGEGNDTYYVDSIGDSVVEMPSQGSDTVISSIALAGAFQDVENYDFSKVAAAVTFIGSSLDNKIISGKSIDVLAGGEGNDSYYLNNAKDVVIELALGGTEDTIAATFSVDLSKYGEVENATLLGAAALKATGTGAANTLVGNGAANVLDGKGGSDVLQGNKGNDTYYVDSKLDQVVENKGEGTDTVFASVDYTLADHLETLVLLDKVSSGTGNALKNTIVGNDAENVLDGGAAADVLKGGKGDDYYLVDNAADKVVELANQGRDTVISSVDFSLAALVNVEDLSLATGAVKATGNALNNFLGGSAGFNILDGKGGADTMQGGDGTDYYYIDNAGDQVIEFANQGWDSVYSTIAFSNAIANVENYDFSKAKSAVNFTGSADMNMITGSAFADTLIGGDGNDTYYLNRADDKIVEAGGQGIDAIVSSVSITALVDNVEDIALKSGSGALKAIGNDLDNNIAGNEKGNFLSGGAGNDALSGYLGNDTLVGGSGNDTFDFWQSGKGNTMSGHDVVTDFDRNNDLLSFFQIGNTDGDGNIGEIEDITTKIVDKGAGNDVVLYLGNGGTVTFKGIGTGAIDQITDLVADPTTQLFYN